MFYVNILISIQRFFQYIHELKARGATRELARGARRCIFDLLYKSVSIRCILDLLYKSVITYTCETVSVEFVAVTMGFVAVDHGPGMSTNKTF